MERIYLDSSATTPVCPEAEQAMLEAVRLFGNPSSLHSAGLEALAAVRAARARVCRALGVSSTRAVDDALPLGSGDPDGRRLFFTSGGTEADNLAIFGVLNARNFRQTPRVVTTDSEHPAVLRPLEALERAGRIELKKLSTAGGTVDPGQLEELLTPNTVLLSVMSVNNETGAVYGVQKLFALARKRVPDIVTHTDNVQGFLKMRLPSDRLGADLVSVSGHKIGAPKGVGALLVNNRLLRSRRIVPLIYGGGQEGGLRSGTENVPGILAFGAACAAAQKDLERFLADSAELRRRFCEALPEDVTVHEPKGERADHIISVELPGIRSETMLHYLSDRGVCVSSGSACSSHGGHGSYVLTAFGCTGRQADCTVRVSLGSRTTEEEVLAAAQAIRDGTEKLVRTLKD